MTLGFYNLRKRNVKILTEKFPLKNLPDFYKDVTESMEKEDEVLAKMLFKFHLIKLAASKSALQELFKEASSECLKGVR